MKKCSENLIILGVMGEIASGKAFMTYFVVMGIGIYDKERTCV